VPQDTRRYLKIAAVALIILVLSGYSYSKAEKILSGPQIIIDTPKNGETAVESLAVVSGKIKNASTITLNGRQIYTDEEENVREEVLLTYGYNLIEIKAQDKFGKEAVKMLELVYK